MTIAEHNGRSDVLRIVLLGQFRVERGTRAIDESAWKLRKARSLVKILALAPERRLHREQVMDLLWPDSGPESALRSLNQALYAARQALLSLYDGTLQPGDMIRQHQQVLTLLPLGPVWIDTHVFETRAWDASRSGDARAFDEAVALYGDDLLPEDLYEDWAGERRHMLKGLYLSLLHEFASRFEARGELARAIDVVQRSILVEPENEDAHAGLMRLYALSGRRQQALQQYQQLTDLLRREFDAEPGPRTVELYRHILEGRVAPARPLVESVPLPDAASAGDVPKRSIFGRDAELKALAEDVRSGLGGQGRVVLLAGDAGIGKTTLAERVSQPLAHSGAVLVYWGRCSQEEGAPAYWPWVQLLRDYLDQHDDETIARDLGRGAPAVAQLVPEVGERLGIAPDVSRSRFQLFDALSRVFKRISERRPLLLVLDDLHWSDRSSLLLLDYLSQDIRPARLVVLGAYRESELDRYHPLQQALGQIVRQPQNRRIPLSGFDRHDAARFIAVSSGVTPSDELVSAVHELTEGNPFFIGEVVQLLMQRGGLDQQPVDGVLELAVPLGVREVMHQRLSRLSAETRDVLGVCSVFGREFGVQALRLVCDLPADRLIDALEEALSTRILLENRDEPGRYRFSHALIRETIYDDIGVATRTRIHGAIGEAFEDVYAGNIDAHLAELAHHFHRAMPRHDVPKTVDYLARAGERAMRQLGFDEASIWFQRALQVLDLATPVDYPRRCELLLALGDAQRAAGESARSRETCLQAALLAQRLQLPELLARAASTVAWATMEIRPYDAQVVRLLEGALQALGPADSIYRVQVLGALVRALDYVGDVERRAALGEEAVAVARRLNDPETLVHALEGRIKSAIRPDDLDQTIADAEEIIRLADQVGDSYMAILGHWWRIDGVLARGDIAAVDHSIAVGSRLSAERGEPRRIWEALCYQTMRALLSGNYEDAERLANEAVEAGRRPAPRPSWSTYVEHMFIIRREQGRLGELESDLRERVANYGDFPYYRALLDVLLLDTGRLEEARDVYERLASRKFQDVPRDVMWLATIALLSELAFRLDDARRALLLYEMVKHYPDRVVVPDAIEYSLGSAAHFIGLLAQAIGRPEEARRAFETAIDVNARLSARPYLAHSCHAYARLLASSAREDDRQQALGLVSEALDIAHAHRMPRLARQCIALRADIQRTMSA